MPYVDDFCGVYRVVDTSTSQCYVGQSRRVKKRISEHFRLLRLGRHPNEALQAAYDRAPKGAIIADVEVVFEDPRDMDAVEEAFLSGDAWFDSSPGLFNISSTARTPMQGRRHTETTKEQIRRAKLGRTEHVTEQYREKLSAVRRQSALADPEFRERVKFLVQNPHLSYAERGRRAGMDTSSARKLALKYANHKDLFDAQN
jgi:hypothetical protein